MRQAYVLGVGMTRFGKHLDRSMKALAAAAVDLALADVVVKQCGLSEVFGDEVPNIIEELMAGDGSPPAEAAR